MRISHLFKETLKRRTLGRAIQNHALSTVSLSGAGIDLGAGNNSGSYYEYITIAPDTEIHYADLHPQSEKVFKIDLEKELPIADNSYDFVILNNVLEAIYNHQLCIDECCRILKPGGVITGVVPFFHRIHPDPEDYFRYTQPSLEKIFSKAGFKTVDIEPLGYGVFSACANTCAAIVKIRVLIFLIYCASIFLDKTVTCLGNILFKNSDRGESWSKEYTPIYYFFTCKK